MSYVDILVNENDPLKFYICAHNSRSIDYTAFNCIINQYEVNYCRTTSINFLSIAFVVYELWLQFRKTRFHSNAGICPHSDHTIQFFRINQA